LCFPSSPRTIPFQLKIVERHPYSTQMFIPMTASHYLVIVALGGDKPDFSTLKVFRAKKNQGISYHPGIWHSPLVSLGETEADYTCIVFEDGTSGDCEEFYLEDPILVKVKE